MKKNRIVYSIVLIFAMILCYSYPSPVTSMFGYSLLFLPIVSFIYVMMIYRDFTYTQEIDQKFITKGEKVSLICTIHNESKFLYPDIEVNFYGTDSVLVKYFKSRRVSVEASSKKHYTYELECKYRGYYEVGIQKACITDFLGLIRIPYNVFDPKYITVYPRIIPLNIFPIQNNAMDESEVLIDRRIGEGTIVSDIRPYAYGDSVRKVHWKLTAKKQELMVKNYDSTSEAMAHVILDLSKNDYDIEANTILEDKVIECVVAVIYYCLTHFIPVDFIYHNEKLVKHSAKNSAHFDEIYQLLFKIRFDQDIAFDKVMNLSREIGMHKSNIILVTSKLNYDLYHQLYHFVMDGSTVILIYVSPKEVTGVEDENIPIIIKALAELKVKCFEVAISDDIKQVLEG